MANTIQLGRTDNGNATVTPVGTTSATTATLINGVNTCPAASGASAVKLPTFAAGPVIVRNTTGDATALLVFPPTLGSLNGATVTTGSVSIAATAVAVFWPHSNGLDFTAAEPAAA
jgi:hypothetical protein